MCAQAGAAPSVDLPLIRVRGLTVRYLSADQTVPALAEVDFDIARGEIVGILGESGSGKSTLALSILGLLPRNACVEGSILFQREAHHYEHLLRLAERQWRKIRGVRIAMIFQEPGLSLSPVMRVGDQIAEVLRAHRDNAGKQQKQDVEAMLRRVRLVDAERISSAYPHQLSGGELHRIAIAQALACAPDLVIADEPTRSLDVTVQSEILNVLREVNRENGSALILITHNPALLAGFADRVMVTYAGRIVEGGPVEQVFHRPLHPYTKALLQLIPWPSPHFDPVLRRLQVIPGSQNHSDPLACGCAFEPRCPARTTLCQTEMPNTVTLDDGRQVSCFNYGN